MGRKVLVRIDGSNEPTSVHYEGGCGEVHTDHEPHVRRNADGEVIEKTNRLVICDACARVAEAAGDEVEVVESGDKASEAKAEKKSAGRGRRAKAEASAETTEDEAKAASDESGEEADV